MKRLTLVFILVTIIGCTKTNSSFKDGIQESEWLVDEKDIKGSLAMFPLGENPEFTTVANTNLSDNERVGIMSFGDEVRVYPYSHTLITEIINDEHLLQKYAFTYCPITKSALAYTRTKIHRASGYRYKDNMVPWDEDTETLWSQMLVRGIRGSNINQRLNTLPIVEARWEIVKTYFPNAKVMKNFVPVNSSSKIVAKSNASSSRNSNLPDGGDLVFGVLGQDDKVSVFQYEDFVSQNRYDVLIRQEGFRAYNYLVYGSVSKKIITAFIVDNFFNYQTLSESEFPYILQDVNGTKYNVLGVGTNGEVLEPAKYAYVAAWWAFEDIFTDFTFQE